MGGASLKSSSNTPSADSPTIFEWMLRLSEFYGLVIAMHYREHGVPHFHASYAGHAASIAIETLEPIGGSCPRELCDWFASGAKLTAPTSLRIGIALVPTSPWSASSHSLRIHNRCPSWFT